jgi:2-polyprenyl-6-hydroxyphenyl methylase/3-demethylubiquinone-9 3-methyltransferase
MEIRIEDNHLTLREKTSIEALLSRQNPSLSNDLEQMWYLMDLIWEEYGCDARQMDAENISTFYSHPVWLLNGLFIEQDPVSMSHRQAISDWVVQQKLKYVVDYGGGFGTLARLIAQKDKNIRVDIYEPHPSEFGLKRAAEYDNIYVVQQLGKDYDCLISTDVLEHVPDPLQDLATMIESVKTRGYLIIANAFYPMIKCHLPQHFHFRYTFNLFVKMMGLRIVGRIEGSHATIYQKESQVEPDWHKLRRLEKISKKLFPVIEALKPVLKPLKRVI